MKPTIEFGLVGFTTYRLAVATALVVAAVLTFLVGRRLSGAATWKVGLAVLAAVAVAIPGARLLALSAESCSRCDGVADLWATHGGLAFLGGVAVGTAAVYLVCRAVRLPFGAMADAAAPATLVALAIGRLGCLAAGCCYGKPTNGPFAAVFDRFDVPARPVGVPLHPTQVYESILAAAIALVVYVLLTRPTVRARPGFAAAVALVGYGTGRFLVEFLRADERGGWGGLSTSQWGGLLLVMAGIAALLGSRIRDRCRGPAKPSRLTPPGTPPTPRAGSRGHPRRSVPGR